MCIRDRHNGIFGMNVYHVPITPILAMILLVSLLQIVLSCVLSSNLKKETLVERIKMCIRDRYPEYPYSEVVGYTEHSDGTITLNVHVVYPYCLLYTSHL